MKPSKQFTYEEIFKDKNTILFFPAHPDDIVVYFGALIRKLIEDKKNVIIINNGPAKPELPPKKVNPRVVFC